MRIGDILSRMSATPSTAAIAAAADRSTVVLAIKRDWKGAMETIQEKIERAESGRRALVATRRETLVAGLDGDADTKTLSRIEGDIAAADRDLARLRDARDLAAERAEADDQAKARAERAEAIARWRTDAAALQDEAAKIDATLAALAPKIAALANSAELLAQGCPVRLPMHPADRPLSGERVLSAVRRRFATVGATWAWPMPIDHPGALPAADVVEDTLAWANDQIDQIDRPT